MFALQSKNVVLNTDYGMTTALASRNIYIFMRCTVRITATQVAGKSRNVTHPVLRTSLLSLLAAFAAFRESLFSWLLMKFATYPALSWKSEMMLQIVLRCVVLARSYSLNRRGAAYLPH